MSTKVKAPVAAVSTFDATATVETAADQFVALETAGLADRLVLSASACFPTKGAPAELVRMKTGRKTPVDWHALLTARSAAAPAPSTISRNINIYNLFRGAYKPAGKAALPSPLPVLATVLPPLEELSPGGHGTRSVASIVEDLVNAAGGVAAYAVLAAEAAAIIAGAGKRGARKTGDEKKTPAPDVTPAPDANGPENGSHGADGAFPVVTRIDPTVMSDDALAAAIEAAETALKALVAERVRRSESNVE